MAVWNTEFCSGSSEFIAEVSRILSSDSRFASYNDSKYMVFPGFCDVHVHLREPGFSYKETIASGTAAAAAGGYTDLCSMPNLRPVPDCYASLKEQLDRISSDAAVRVTPYGSVTVGEQGQELSAMEELSPFVCGFTDDGKGVQSEEMTLRGMQKAAALGKIFAAHCEDESLLHGGYIHDGAYAAAHGHRGISSESEWRPLERDLYLAKKAGCKYHVCHVSTAESVDLIRRAKRDGVDVTCETAPHYLVLDETDLQEDGRFKMNPPLRAPRDRSALIEGLLDGTVDMIATDHAPHSVEEKSKGLEKSFMGIVGLETAFPILYTELVRPGVLPLPLLTEKMTTAPRRRFGLPCSGFCIRSLEEGETVDPDRFLSHGRATPFAGRFVYGINQITVCGGTIVWKR